MYRTKMAEDKRTIVILIRVTLSEGAVVWVIIIYLYILSQLWNFLYQIW